MSYCFGFRGYDGKKAKKAESERFPIDKQTLYVYYYLRIHPINTG
jgi:hypothetical protein